MNAVCVKRKYCRCKRGYAGHPKTLCEGKRLIVSISKSINITYNYVKACIKSQLHKNMQEKLTSFNAIWHVTTNFIRSRLLSIPGLAIVYCFAIYEMFSIAGRSSAIQHYQMWSQHQ